MGENKLVYGYKSSFGTIGIRGAGLSVLVCLERTSSGSSTRRMVPHKLRCTLRLDTRGVVLQNAFPFPLSFCLRVSIASQ